MKSSHKTILAYVNQSEALIYKKLGFKVIDGHHPQYEDLTRIMNHDAKQLIVAYKLPKFKVKM